VFFFMDFITIPFSRTRKEREIEIYLDFIAWPIASSI